MISSKLKKRLLQRKEKLKRSGGGNFNYFLIKQGITRMRLVQAPPDKEFAVEATFFYINKDIGGIVSPVTFGEPCAIMELYQKLKNSKRDSDKKIAEKIKPKKRYFAMHYKYLDEKGRKPDTESGVKLTILTAGQYQDLIDLYLDEEAGDMSNPKRGYDVKYKREGTTQFDTEYSTMRCNPTPMASKYAGKIYDPEVALRKIIPTYERTQEIAEEVYNADMADRSLKKKKKKSRDI